jgi:prevent-host-death family protein
MHQWQLQEAKNRLSQVVRDAQTEGPQVITQHGRETAIVLSMEAYRALTRRQTSLVAFFQSSPLVGEGLTFERPDEPAEVMDL